MFAAECSDPTCSASFDAHLSPLKPEGAVAMWNRRTPPLDPTNETQVATLALAGFELERDYWDSAEFSQHESRLREWARVTLGKLGGGG